nr:helix-turn-helix transcriptional regulator [Allomuricauda sp.]
MKVLKSGSYYGVKKSELDNPGFVLSEYGYHLKETDWHYHENPYFMFVLDGNLKDMNKKGTRLCPAGSFMFLNWQETHKNTKETSYAKGFHIELDRNWFQEQKWERNLWEGSKLLLNPRFHHTVAKIYYEFNLNDSCSAISLDSLVLQLCEDLWEDKNREYKAEPDWVNKLQELVYDDVLEPTLDSLSEVLGIHPVHLSRSLPKYLNTTLGDYIRGHKIKKSIPLLTNDNYSLTEVAYSCGFSDQSHYTRSFKQYFNITPKVFRRMLK